MDPRYRKHGNESRVESHQSEQVVKKEVKPINEASHNESKNTGVRTVLFLLSAVCLIYFLHSRGAFDKDSKLAVVYNNLPKDLRDLKRIEGQMKQQLSQHFIPFFVGYVSFYILKQMFSIPGSALLNVIAGNLFGLWLGFPLLTAIGASLCYWMSYTIGRRTVKRIFSKKIEMLHNAVSNNRDNLFFYLLFLRLVPFTPNWFLNLASPIIEVPFPIFLSTILIGLSPYNFLCVQAGSILSEIESTSDIFDGATILKLLLIALCALVPIFVKKLSKSKTTNS